MPPEHKVGGSNPSGRATFQPKDLQERYSFSEHLSGCQQSPIPETDSRFVLDPMHVLPSMEFITAGSDYATQVKALFEQGQRLPLGPFVGFFLAYEYLNLISQGPLMDVERRAAKILAF